MSDHRPHYGRVAGSFLEIDHKFLRDLDAVNRIPAKIHQRRKAGAEIVDGDPEPGPSEPQQNVTMLARRAHEHALRKLELHPVGECSNPNTEFCMMGP